MYAHKACRINRRYGGEILFILCHNKIPAWYCEL